MKQNIPQGMDYVLGTIENYEDEAHTGRVKILLKLEGKEIVSDWAPVIRPYGGNGQGLWTQPEIGELVLCGFIDNNPASPFVIGSVYDSANLPPVEEKGENNIKLLQTSRGSEIRIEDEEGKENLTISMDEGKMIIKLDKKKGLSMINESGDITVKCKNLKMEGSGNGKIISSKEASFSVSGNLTLKGSTTAGASASGNGIIKGSKVKLEGIVLAGNMPAAKQNDQVMGVDIHIVEFPSPGGPVPVPLPHPFAGKLTDKLSRDVTIKGKPVAVKGSVAEHNPPGHIPMGPKFQKNPSGKGTVELGTIPTVKVNGKEIAVMGSMVKTCNDPTDMPTSSVIVIP